MQIACKFIDMLKINCFVRKNECTQPLLALYPNNWLYGRVFHNSRIFLQKINIGDRNRLKTAQYCRLFRGFELAYQCMEMLNKRYHHIHSHQHCLLSMLHLSVLQSVSACFALQIVPSVSLHSFKLVFLVLARN